MRSLTFCFAFVGFYGCSVSQGEPSEAQKQAAATDFVEISLGDIDGADSGQIIESLPVGDRNTAYIYAQYVRAEDSDLAWYQFRVTASTRWFLVMRIDCRGDCHLVADHHGFPRTVRMNSGNSHNTFGFSDFTVANTASAQTTFTFTATETQTCPQSPRRYSRW